MPFTSEEITTAGMTSLDFYVRGKPIDQVAVERPWLARLMKTRKSFPGAKQYVVEQIRTGYQSNFQWFRGADTVTYNKRKTVKQANFPWRSAHDGFALDEDRLAQNGIIIIEGKTGTASNAEIIQLTNLLEEQNEVLRLGFEESFDQALHQDGTSDSDAIEGLDLLVSKTPASGVVGGIDPSTDTYWRNGYAGSLNTTQGDANEILSNMETQWRACIRNGGRPDFIMAGSTYVDALRTFMLNNFGRIDYGPMSAKSAEVGGGHDSGVDTSLRFHGVPIIWNPVFADLGGTWEKRCYFINTKHLKLRPLEGHDMVTRKPPRAYDRYQYYWGLTWRGALCTNRRNAHAVLELA